MGAGGSGSRGNLSKTPLAGSLTDKAYQYVRSEIIGGRVAPGVNIDTVALSDQLGVSRTPLREALLRLANEGIVAVTARKGIAVIPITAAALQEIYQVITALEVEAVGLLARSRPTLEELTDLTDQIVHMRNAIATSDRESWILSDEAFHRSILQLSGNSHLADIGCSQRDRAQRAHFVALRLVPLEQMAASTERHGELTNALVSEDPDTVMAIHREQRTRGANLLVTSLRELGLDHL